MMVIAQQEVDGRSSQIDVQSIIEVGMRGITTVSVKSLESV